MRLSAVEPSTAPPKSAVASGTHMTETTLGPAEAIHYRVKLELPLNLATQKQAPPVTPTVPQEQGRNRDLNFKSDSESCDIQLKVEVEGRRG